MLAGVRMAICRFEVHARQTATIFIQPKHASKTNWIIKILLSALSTMKTSIYLSHSFPYEIKTSFSFKIECTDDVEGKKKKKRTRENNLSCWN